MRRKCASTLLWGHGGMNLLSEYAASAVQGEQVARDVNLQEVVKAREYTASLLRGAREFLVAVRGPGQVRPTVQHTREAYACMPIRQMLQKCTAAQPDGPAVVSDSRG